MTPQFNYDKYHRTFAAIDLSAIDQNLRAVQGYMKPGVKTMAVVKADAYGHGSVRVSKHIEDRVDYFAVTCIGEARELRDGGITKPILILTYTNPACYDDLIDGNIAATVYNEEEAKLLSQAALAKGKKAIVHVSVDTGMGRIGFAPTRESADTVARIAGLPGIILEGLFSHYACADRLDKTDADDQTRLFDGFIQMLEQRGVEIPIKHICNSAGTMDFDKQYDMCRVGIVLYGLYPSQQMDRQKVKLRPAMKIVSHVIHVKTVPAGFKIGYGHIYTAPSERKIATVAIGYADGYNRCLTGVGYVLIRGKKASVVGAVCMDQIMVDVTEIEDVAVGEHAVILGKSGTAEITAEELGEMSHSFNYEVVCNFMPRVNRIYYLGENRA